MVMALICKFLDREYFYLSAVLKSFLGMKLQFTPEQTAVFSA